MTLQLADLGPTVLAPSRRSGSAATGTHFVNIYETRSELIEGIARFLSLGFLSGESAVVLASADHRTAIIAALQDEGHDVEALSGAGRFHTLDAEEALERVMDDGVPKKARFSAMMGALIEEAALGDRGVRIFGELVTLLMERGNVAGAIRIEELWNEQAETHSFQLYCGYPASFFGEDNLPQLTEVCRQHTHVVLSRS